MENAAEALIRPASPAMDAILGKSFPVLSDGFVRVVDYMGTEASIVQAARVSYGAGTKTVSDDVGLVRYLMRHRHTTPLEMCEIKFHMRMPMDVNRQHIRHRTASANEYSTRYSEAINSTEVTASDQWRLQATDNKQGSNGKLAPEFGVSLSQREAELHNLARRVYEERLDAGVAREQARKDLPLSTYTELYWKIDLHNLLHYLSLRWDSHAQYEIRMYAEAMVEIVRQWVPNVWAAFLEYRAAAITLHATERVIVRAMQEGNMHVAMDAADRAGFLKKRSRERIEFEAKLAELGILPPWQEANLL